MSESKKRSFSMENERFFCFHKMQLLEKQSLKQSLQQTHILPTESHLKKTEAQRSKCCKCTTLKISQKTSRTRPLSKNKTNTINHLTINRNQYNLHNTLL